MKLDNLIIYDIFSFEWNPNTSTLTVSNQDTITAIIFFNDDFDGDAYNFHNSYKTKFDSRSNFFIFNPTTNRLRKFELYSVISGFTFNTLIYNGYDLGQNDIGIKCEIIEFANKK